MSHHHHRTYLHPPMLPLPLYPSPTSSLILSDIHILIAARTRSLTTLLHAHPIMNDTTKAGWDVEACIQETRLRELVAELNHHRDSKDQQYALSGIGLGLRAWSDIGGAFLELQSALGVGQAVVLDVQEVVEVIEGKGKAKEQ